MNLSKVPAWVYVVLSLPVIVLILSVAFRLINIEKLPEATDDGMSGQDGKKIGIAFGIVFAVEFIRIATAAVILNKNAPRTLDIDIILFDGWLLEPNLWRYAHRAVPVAEIYPDYLSSRGDTLKDVAAELTKTTLIHLRSDVLVGCQIQTS